MKMEALKLQAWRTVGKNPCDAPPISISIGPADRTQLHLYVGIVPWVLTLQAAQKIFGPVVDAVTEEPVPVSLSLQLKEDT